MCINFSIILSRLRQMKLVCNLSILVLTLLKKTGKILAIFNLSGKILNEKLNERLKSTERLSAIQSYANFIIFIGMLLGPVALSQPRSDIMSTSSFVHGLMKIDSLHGFFKKWLKDLQVNKYL